MVSQARQHSGTFLPSDSCFSHKTRTMLVPQALYLSDLAPAHFFLFAKLKSILKERQSESV